MLLVDNCQVAHVLSFGINPLVIMREVYRRPGKARKPATHGVKVKYVGVAHCIWLCTEHKSLH